MWLRSRTTASCRGRLMCLEHSACCCLLFAVGLPGFCCTSMTRGGYAAHSQLVLETCLQRPALGGEIVLLGEGETEVRRRVSDVRVMRAVSGSWEAEAAKSRPDALGLPARTLSRERSSMLAILTFVISCLCRSFRSRCRRPAEGWLRGPYERFSVKFFMA